MTYQEFKKGVLKNHRYEKFYHYFLAVSVIIVGFFFFYKALFNPSPNISKDSVLLLFIFSAFCLSLGILALYLIPNRYKIQTFDSHLSSENKVRVITETMEELMANVFENTNDISSFYYQRKRWTFAYTIYTAFEEDKIFVSVLGSTNGGFIDFGQTNKLRRKISLLFQHKLGLRL